MQKIPSPKVEAAEIALKGGLQHYLLMLFEFKTNFENEAIKCLPLIHQSIELLMREYFEDRVGCDFEVEPKTMVELIKEYGWYRKEHREAVVWINKHRNRLIHKGWTDTSNRAEILRNLGESIEFVRELYQELDFDLADVFPSLDRILLNVKGSNWQQLFWQSINWQYVSEALVNSAIQDYRDEPQSSLDISNKAFDIALRGFARSWRIYGWDTLTLPEIIEEMNFHEDEWARFWWWNNSDPTNTETSRDKNNFWFIPPMKVSDLSKSPFEDKTPQYTAQYYAVEVKEMVKSFIYRTPMLELMECVFDNWNNIIGEMKNKYHDLDVPAIDFEDWANWPFYNRTICIKIKREYRLADWTEKQKKDFLDIVSGIYFENLDYMNVEFINGVEI